MNRQNGGAVQTLLNAVFFVPALVYMAIRDSGEWLYKKTYDGQGFWRNLFVSALALAISCATAASTASYCAQALGWGTVAWFPLSLVVFTLTASHVWPLIYLGVIKHLLRFFDWYGKQVGRFSKHVYVPSTRWFVSTLRLAPGSDYLWRIVEGQNNGSVWGIKFLQLALVLVAAFAVYSVASLSYVITLSTVAASTLPIFNTLHITEVAAAIVAASVAYLAAVPMFVLIDEGNEPSTALVYSFLGTYYLVVTTGVSGIWTIGCLSVAAVLVGVAYVVPAFVAVLQGGLVQKFLKNWDELLNSTYNTESNLAFRKMYHHVMNIAVSVLIALFAFSFDTTMYLPVAATASLVTLVAVYLYTYGTKELIEDSTGQFWIGMSVLATVGYFANETTVLTGFASYGGTFGVVAVTGLVAYPLAYKLLKATTSWAAPAVGDFLANLQEVVRKNIGRVVRAVRTRVYSLQVRAFADESDFSSMFGHLLSLAFAASSVVLFIPVAPANLSAVWTVGLVSLIGVNVFVLFDQVTSRFSAATLAVVLGGGTMFVVANTAIAANITWLGAAISAILSGYIVGGIVAPALYLALRGPANLLVTPWLAPIVSQFFNYIWKAYKSVWKQVGKLVVRVVDLLTVFVKPALVLASRVLRSVWSFVSKQFVLLTKAIYAILKPVGLAVSASWAAAKAFLVSLTGRSK